MLTADRPNSAVRLAAQAPFPYLLPLWSSAVFALQIAIARLGYGLALPAIRNTLHGDYALYGAINAASLGGYLVGALVAPRVIARVRSAVLLSSVVAGVALILSGCASNALFFGAARTAFGIASGISIVAATVQSLEVVDARRRGTASALIWGGIGFGLVLSAIGAGWVVHGTINWRIASFATGALMALIGIGYDAAVRNVAGASVDLASAKQPLQVKRFTFLCLSYFSFGFAYIAYATFIVASVDARLGVQGGRATVEALWGLYGVSSVVGTVAMGRLLQSPIGRWGMALCGFASTIGCVVAVLSPHALVPSAILIGLGLTATPTAATAFARARSTSVNAPVALAVVTVAVGLGQLIGPVAAGISADRLGLGSVAVVACSVYLLQTLCATIDAVS